MAKGRFHTELFETKERLTEVRNRYLSLIEQLKDKEKIIVVDGDRSVDQIANAIWKEVSALF